MISLLLSAAGQASGRGDSPSRLGGILLIIGAIVVAVAVIALVFFLIGRASRHST